MFNVRNVLEGPGTFAMESRDLAGLNLDFADFRRGFVKTREWKNPTRLSYKGISSRDV